MTLRYRSVFGRTAALLAVAVLGLAPCAEAAAAKVDTSLLEAARRNADTSAVRTLLAGGADPNTRQPDGATPLLWAAHFDNVATASALIAAGAKVDAANDYGMTPLAVACTNGSEHMATVLLKAGADPNQANPSGVTPLMMAANTGNVSVVKTLLAHKADIHAREKFFGQTALMWAAAEQHVGVAEALLEAGADPKMASNSGFTPLLFAAREGNIPLVRLFLDRGVDINTTSKTKATPTGPGMAGLAGGVPPTGASGEAALHIAVLRGHVPLALYLLDRGANPNADGPGFTALHWAVWRPLATITGDNVVEQGEWSVFAGIPDRSEKLALIRALIKKGADVNARVVRGPFRFGGGIAGVGGRGFRTYMGGNEAGATPFIFAAHSADMEVMRLLLAHGADPSLTTNEGANALMIAAGLGTLPDDTSVKETDAVKAVELCFALGNDPNRADKNGNTALHAVGNIGRNLVTRFLVQQAGAKLNVENKRGLTPLEIATESNESGMLAHYNPETAKLMKELGATK